MQVDRGRTPRQGEEEPEAGFIDAKLLSLLLSQTFLKKIRVVCLSFL